MDGNTDQNSSALKPYVRATLSCNSPTDAPERANEAVAANDRKALSHGGYAAGKVTVTVSTTSVSTSLGVRFPHVLGGPRFRAR